MTNQQRMVLVKQIYNLIFTGKSLNINQWSQTPKPEAYAPLLISWVPRTFVSGTVRGIDIDVNDDGRVLQLRFMEQNMNKADKVGNLKPTAIRARNGEFIMWVVDRNKKTDAFLGSIQDGKWVESQMRATQPVSAQVMAAGASPNRFTGEEIPGIPAGMDTPEYVIQTLDEDIDAFEPENFDFDAYDPEDIGEQTHDPGQ